MLHSCEQCHMVYLVSDYRNLCNSCGEQLQQQIEKLYEADNAENWIVLMSRAVHGEQPRRRRRWRIG